jgi:hypothetical protein
MLAMGYHQELANSARWIASIQQEDNGWGLAPGQGSSIVNTAEALYVLNRAGGFNPEIAKGLDYIQRNVFEHVKSRNPRTRYVSYSLLAFADNRIDSLEKSIAECCNWLLKARNTDNGWSTESGKTPSELFPTFLALWSLQAASWPEKELEPSLHWILSRAGDVGWSLQPNYSPTPVATAYALLCLSASKYRDDQRVLAGKNFLLQNKQWEVQEEVIVGAVWKHCPYAWVIPALIRYGEDPYSIVIAEGIRYINSLKSESGGWTETQPAEGKTVRAQYWSVLALDSVFRSFDPSIHVPRIDADRAQDNLNEPYFVKIGVRTRFAIIIPSFLYRYLTYFLILLAFISLLGFHRLLNSLPIRTDSTLAILFLFCSWLFINKRPKQFPKLTRYTTFILSLLAGLDLIFGFHLDLILNNIKEFIIWIFHNLGINL